MSVRPLLLMLFGAFLASAAWADDPTGASGELERVAGTTPPEKLAYATAAIDEMRDDIKSTTKMLELAQRADVSEEEKNRRIQCINNHLTSMKALDAVSESAATAMKEDIANGDMELADHELRKIAVALEKTRQLYVEAQACDDETQAAGVTTVTVSGAVGDATDTQGTTYDELDVGSFAPETSPFM